MRENRFRDFIINNVLFMICLFKKEFFFKIFNFKLEVCFILLVF